MALLSVEEIRRLATVPAGMEDEDVQILLDAAEQAIDAKYGPLGSTVTEVIDGGFSYLVLRRRASEITEITETVVDVDTIIAEDDFRLRGDGLSLLRLQYGTNVRTFWGAPVTVEYVPADDEADRKRVQLELVRLDLNHEPGAATSERIGDWQEDRSSNSAWNYETERATILNSLIGPPLGSALGFV